MLCRALAPLLLLLTLASCDQVPVDAFVLAPQSLQQRQQESRRFDGIKEADLLAACAGVLQDLGFNLEESETELGLVVASKDRDATSGGQIAAAVFVALLTGAVMAVDKNQKVRASLVVAPSSGGAPDSHIVRITLQRIIWNTQGLVRATEWIKEPEVYQQFFDRLSKAVFLEGHKI